MVRLLTRHGHVHVLDQLSLTGRPTASLVLVPLLRHLGAASEVSERYLIHLPRARHGSPPHVLDSPCFARAPCARVSWLVESLEAASVLLLLAERVTTGVQAFLVVQESLLKLAQVLGRLLAEGRLLLRCSWLRASCPWQGWVALHDLQAVEHVGVLRTRPMSP